MEASALLDQTKAKVVHFQFSSRIIYRKKLIKSINNSHFRNPVIFFVLLALLLLYYFSFILELVNDDPERCSRHVN